MIFNSFMHTVVLEQEIKNNKFLIMWPVLTNSFALFWFPFLLYFDLMVDGTAA